MLVYKMDDQLRKQNITSMAIRPDTVLKFNIWKFTDKWSGGPGNEFPSDGNIDKQTGKPESLPGTYDTNMRIHYITARDSNGRITTFQFDGGGGPHGGFGRGVLEDVGLIMKRRNNIKDVAAGVEPDLYRVFLKHRKHLAEIILEDELPPQIDAPPTPRELAASLPMPPQIDAPPAPLTPTELAASLPMPILLPPQSDAPRISDKEFYSARRELQKSLRMTNAQIEDEAMRAGGSKRRRRLSKRRRRVTKRRKSTKRKVTKRKKNKKTRRRRR